MAPTQPLIIEQTTAQPGLAARFRQIFPGGQFLRYLGVGGFNTLFGYTTYAILFTVLARAIPARLLYLAAPLASVLATPINITVAFLGYKWIVFRTRGNYLREWLKCFAVYGLGMLPGLIALGALTRFLQGLLARHANTFRPWVSALEAHLHGGLLAAVQNNAHARNLAGYLAGAIVIACSTVYSFIGHKKVTFKTAADESESYHLESRKPDIGVRALEP